MDKTFKLGHYPQAYCFNGGYAGSADQADVSTERNRNAILRGSRKPAEPIPHWATYLMGGDDDWVET
jgi:hypothetical protein